MVRKSERYKYSKDIIVTLFVIFILVMIGVSVGSYFVGKNVAKKEIASLASYDSQIVKSMNFDGDCNVIGHLNPDTDTVASAIIAADLYQKAFGVNCVAAVSGRINNETKFVLQNFNVETPNVLSDAKGKKIILVDHSTFAQSIEGMSEAEIMAVYDHHNLGDIQTKAPLLMRVSPVGSTATIMYIQYKENGLKISKSVAGLMLSAILSDTNYLSSATTMSVDKEAVDALKVVAGVDDLDAYYAKMQEAAASYEGMSDAEILQSDYKKYDMSGVSVGIASVNAKNAVDAEALKERMITVLEEDYVKQGVDYVFVVINNQQDDKSVIFGYGEGVEAVMTQAFGSTEATLSPIASRKKDIVPKLEAVLVAGILK